MHSFLENLITKITATDWMNISSYTSIRVVEKPGMIVLQTAEIKDGVSHLKQAVPIRELQLGKGTVPLLNEDRSFASIPIEVLIGENLRHACETLQTLYLEIRARRDHTSIK